MQTVPLAARVAASAKRQHGVVTRAQLVELGLGVRQIEAWANAGRLERLLPSVFRLAGAPATREQALRAAVLWAGDALVSHRSAGELWGFDGIKATRPEVTVALGTGKKSAKVTVHQTRGSMAGRRTRRGIPTTTPERTIVDLAGVVSAAELEVAFESARRERLVTTASVARALASAGARGRAGAEPLQALLTALASEPPCESALEVLTARLLRASDLPRPQRQVEVVASGATYRLDFAWPDAGVALECDGRRWHAIEADFERDRDRWSAITAQTGYRFVWATWRRVNDAPSELVMELAQLLMQPASRRARGRLLPHPANANAHESSSARSA